MYLQFGHFAEAHCEFCLCFFRGKKWQPIWLPLNQQLPPVMTILGGPILFSVVADAVARLRLSTIFVVVVGGDSFDRQWRRSSGTISTKSNAIIDVSLNEYRTSSPPTTTSLYCRHLCRSRQHTLIFIYQIICIIIIVLVALVFGVGLLIL